MALKLEGDGSWGFQRAITRSFYSTAHVETAKSPSDLAREPAKKHKEKRGGWCGNVWGRLGTSGGVWGNLEAY